VPVPTASFIGWFTGLGWDAREEKGAPVVPGPRILPSPDKLLTFTPVPGPGYVLEGDADASAFQLRTRGPQNDQAAAEALAYLADSLILRASFPAVLDGGQVLIHVHRLGGTPSLLAPGPDTGSRFELVCTYIAIAGT
jgi:hypothetical protein